MGEAFAPGSAMSVPPHLNNSINNNHNNNNSTPNTTITSANTETSNNSDTAIARPSAVTGEESVLLSKVEEELGVQKEDEEVEQRVINQDTFVGLSSVAGCVTPDRVLSGGAASPIPHHHYHHQQQYHQRSSLHHHHSTHSTYPDTGTESQVYETESSSTPREDRESGCSPPAYLRWARHLHTLLQDPDGVALFRRYLELEGRSHADTLEFWFACEGLRKQTDPEHITRLVKAIYRRYFLKTQLGIGEELRKAVNRRIKEAGTTGATLDAAVFDRSQKEVERIITETTYPSFLQSDLYLQHVQAVQNGSSSSSGSASGCSSGSSNGSYSASSGGTTSGGGVIAGSSSGIATVGNTISSSGGCLATLHEDCELDANDTAHGTPSLTALPLTRDMLLVTQKRRASELRPKPEAYAGLYLQPHGKSSHSNNRIHHSSYNPVSRQDSELQSLSSDARTESDNMSMTDSSVDGGGNGGFGSHRYSKKQYQVHCRQVKEAANLNRDPYMHQTVIPRTQRLQKEQTYPMKPDEFAAILIEKLENVKRDQETKESLDRKLLETSDLCGSSVDCVGANILADAIREKLQVDVDNDNDQAILDQHVSRVWSDRTPGLASPPPELRRSRPSNPPINKMSGNIAGGHMGMIPFSMSSHHQHQHHMYQTRPHQRHSHSHSRKERDVFSTFSSDSGNVHDFPEGSEHRLHMTKSKSMPEYGDSNVPGHDARFRQNSREWCGSGSRRWSSKKTELTDSGVSVVSDTPPIPVSHTNKDSRVLSWLLESDKQQICGSGQMTCGSYSAHSGERDSSSSCSLTKSYPHRVRPGALQPALPVGKTCRGVAHSHSRSGSLERTGPAPPTSSGPSPAQPFVADPSMPPLPSPHTPTQLEEARRRLLEDELRSKQPRQRYSSSSGSGNKMLINTSQSSYTVDNPTGGMMTAMQQSAGSTLRRGGNSGMNTGRGMTSSSSGIGVQQMQPQPHPQPVVPPEFCTTVVFSFCDEQFPYRTKIPGQQVTLRQFKEYLPKKGLYRYFFKTECEDVDTKVIQEEIVDDNEILPLWEGKVMAQVKPIE